MKHGERRIQIYEYIKNYIDVNGYPPKLEEIGMDLGVTWQNVRFHIMKLQKEGLIDHELRKHRDLRITGGYKNGKS